MCKQVKQKIDQECKIVDTLYFGTFAKAATIVADQGKFNFIYCPGPKAVLKIIENEENVADIVQSLLDEKLVTLSITELAEASGMTSENVNAILGAIRDEVVDLVMVKKQNVALNFVFGTLNLTQPGTVEFKSISNAQQQLDDQQDKLPVSLELSLSQSARKKESKSSYSIRRQSEVQSRKSNAERNIDFM